MLIVINQQILAIITIMAFNIVFIVTSHETIYKLSSKTVLTIQGSMISCVMNKRYIICK